MPLIRVAAVELESLLDLLEENCRSRFHAEYIVHVVNVIAGAKLRAESIHREDTCE